LLLFVSGDSLLPFDRLFEVIFSIIKVCFYLEVCYVTFFFDFSPFFFMSLRYDDRTVLFNFLRYSFYELSELPVPWMSWAVLCPDAYF
jgi:hypothetical protein